MYVCSSYAQSAVPWAFMGRSLGRADPAVVLTPASYSQSPHPGPTSGPAQHPHQMFSSRLANAHHAHGVRGHRLVAECGIQAGTGGWCLIGF